MDLKAYLARTVALTREALQVTDKQVSRAVKSAARDGRELYCGAGCAACCSMDVWITVPEAIVLAESLDDEQRKRVAERFSRLSSLDRSVADSATLYRDAVGACALLSPDGRCEVYQSRPISCRKVWSLAPPKYCEAGAILKMQERGDLDGLHAYMAFMDGSNHFLSAASEAGHRVAGQLAVASAQMTGFFLQGNLAFMVHLVQQPAFWEGLKCRSKAGFRDALEGADLWSNHWITIED